MKYKRVGHRGRVLVPSARKKPGVSRDIKQPEKSWKMAQGLLEDTGGLVPH
jgi:hypothetical protein